MIKDNLKNAESHHKLGEGFKKGFEFLKNTDMKNLENGKYQIEGDDIFVSVQDYTTKPQEQGKFEAHKKYADIQFIIKGEEKLGFGDVKNFKPVTFYDEKNDIIFLEGDGDFVNAKEGDFVHIYARRRTYALYCTKRAVLCKKGCCQSAFKKY